MKVLVIGAGNMGLPYAKAMANSSLSKRGKFYIYDRNPEKLDRIKKKSRLTPIYTLAAIHPEADIIFLAVEPHDIGKLFLEMKPQVDPRQIFVSIMAGVKLKTIKSGLNVKKVVRTMPNLPAKIRKGVSTYTASREVSLSELGQIHQLIATTGLSIHVENEDFIDISTSISGSGPAYVFYFMQAMFEEAMAMGLDEENSRHLVSNTFEGAVGLFKNADLSPQTWIDRVATKGGTTRKALDVMEEKQIKTGIRTAVNAAYQRANELGKE